jgi:hypothetical protein
MVNTVNDEAAAFWRRRGMLSCLESERPKPGKRVA